jgi:hypothetical protein
LAPLTQPPAYLNGEERTFARTRILLDPAELEDIERKRKKNLEHKREIEAQIAEKRRIKMLEEEVQTLNNIKIEDEARKLSELSQLTEEQRRQQPHYQNLDKILAAKNNKQSDSMATIFQGEKQQQHEENKPAIMDTRSHEIYKKMQEAQLAAAEEKHRRLLKKLKRGGHDTRALESKFAEFKARMLQNANSMSKNNNEWDNEPTGFVNSHQDGGYESYRGGHTALSSVSDHELRLERQKQLLEKSLANKPNKNINTNADSDSSDNSTIKRVFKLLREDSNGLPAEITEEHLKRILNSVTRNDQQQFKLVKDAEKQQHISEKSSKKKQSEETQNVQQQQQQNQAKYGFRNGKPIWNYHNLEGRVAVPNSMKDPFYNERKAFIEERKRRQLEQFKRLSSDGEQPKYSIENEKQQRQHLNQSSRNEAANEQLSTSNRFSSISSTSMTNKHMNLQTTNKPYQQQHQQESIMNLLTRNLANNPIYEEEEDAYLNAQRKLKHSTQANKQQQQAKVLANLHSSSMEDLSIKNGFVPFMRTDEFLNPAHATSPVPPSRESSAIKREREKARQVIFLISFFWF